LLPHDWPSVNLLPYLLLENEWLLGSVLILAGLIVAAVLTARGRKVGLIVAALGVIAILLATVVHTGREQVLTRTRAVSEIIMPPIRDMDAFRDALAPSVIFTIPHVPDFSYDREEIIALAGRVSERYTTEVFARTALKAHMVEPGHGRTYIAIWMLFDEVGQVKTNWVLDWRRGDDGEYRISRIEWLGLNNNEPRPSVLP